MTVETIFWTESALNDLSDIKDYLRIEAPHIARQTIQSILSREQQLMSYPKSGSVETLIQRQDREYRYLIEGHYKMIYHIEGAVIYIDTVFDTRRDPSQLQEIGKD